MLHIEQSILVAAEPHIVWGFMSDLSRSLIYNRFHTGIELPGSYSVKPEAEFTIYHNFGINKVEMTAKIIEWQPMRRIEIEEFDSKQQDKGFYHKCKFEISEQRGSTRLDYRVEGSLNNRIKEASFKPFLIGFMKSELQKIKQAIESSASLGSPLEIQGVVT